MKKYISIALAAVLMSSCVDTVILPYDKTVDEDFWQTKSDVKSMVTGVYVNLLDESYTKRRIVWGALRSDELRFVSDVNYNKDDNSSIGLLELETGNIQTNNIYANWGTVYSTINNCNIVLAKAAPVVDIDPSYTEGDYQADRSQMLAIRALCYFDLVRAFRDVPYSSTAIMNSSQITDIPQSSPAYVLQKCIDDLEEARKNALAPEGYSLKEWERVGYITRDGIDALLADIYLWRASATHNADDYRKCIEYCDNVIEAKKLYSINYGMASKSGYDKEYPIENGDRSFENIFVNQNAEESIFELQYDGSRNSNTGICRSYHFFEKQGSASGFFKASILFSDYKEHDMVYFQKGDFRYLKNCFDVSPTSEQFDIRKMCTDNDGYMNNPSGASAYKRMALTFANYKQNLIIYRLTDVMLMKAEALVQLVADDNAPELTDAFNIVKAVNDRSLSNDMISNDQLKVKNYTGKLALEKLVLEERFRELCFEGKRWYDLLRYNYRHVEGVDYNTTLGAQEEEGREFVANSKEMLDLVARKLGGGGPALSAKTKTEPTLYMPIHQSQIDISPVLKQNPAYQEGSDFEQQ